MKFLYKYENGNSILLPQVVEVNQVLPDIEVYIVNTDGRREGMRQQANGIAGARQSTMSCRHKASAGAPKEVYQKLESPAWQPQCSGMVDMA